MAGKKGMKPYPLELKLEALRLYNEEGRTQAEITALLRIRNPYAVKEWAQIYRREGIQGLQKARGRPRQQESAQAELERLRMENALLKKYHTELRKEALARRNIG
jgi:transposase